MVDKEVEQKVVGLEKSVTELQKAIRNLSSENTSLLSMVTKLSTEINGLKNTALRIQEEQKRNPLSGQTTRY